MRLLRSTRSSRPRAARVRYGAKAVRYGCTSSEFALVSTVRLCNMLLRVGALVQWAYLTSAFQE